MSLALVVGALALGPVELRGGDVVSAPVEEVSIVGVRVGGGESRIIAWDAVRRITGDHEAEAEEFSSIAENAWRARLRLARGDHALAAPLFETLYTRYRNVPGPTALMVAEGTLSCRLAEGKSGEAIEPWLHAVALREAGDTIAGDPKLIPMLDSTTMLVPALPPMWLGPEGIRELISATDLPRTGLAGDLGALYQSAAMLEEGAAVTSTPPDRDHPGVALVRMIVESRAPDPSRREAARFTMLGRLESEAGTWREAWLRAAIGRSYLMEPDPRVRMVGVFHLLHLPARFSSTNPELAAMALALASRELASQGDAAGAESLRAELERLFPGAKALHWLDGPGAVRADPVFRSESGEQERHP